MNARAHITLIAKEHGWNLVSHGNETATGNGIQVWELPGPMIERSDRKRLTVVYTASGASIRSAAYGPDERPRPIPRSMSAVEFHLVQTRSGQRS